METKPSKVMEFGLKVRRKEDIIETKKWQKITDVVVKVFQEKEKKISSANIKVFVHCKYWKICLLIYLLLFNTSEHF